MTPQQISRMRREWEAIRGEDYRRDYQRAVFFRGYRRRYVNGAPGDVQFKADVNEHLKDISGARALDYAKMLRFFRSERQWTSLGGYRSLLHLMNLPTTRDRNRVKVAALARADRDGEPVTYNIVRSIALRLGVRSDAAAGRPTQSEMERKRDVLARFIWNHHDDVPQEVIDAMPYAMQGDFTATT